VNFNKIIGQERTKIFLQQLAASERIPHSMLFLGNNGSGNLALAVAFAQLLQCESPIKGKENTGIVACGECSACRKSFIHTHPDIHFSFPTIGTNAVSTDFLKEWRLFLEQNQYASANTWLQQLNAENKQGNINKDECNAIIKKLSLKIFEGKYKILLMWMPEYLGKEGNRLLKLIEEPPEQTIFLLVAENPDLILNTILSRCQLIKTDLLSDEEVALALQTQRQIEPERAKQLAFLAGGDFGAALEAAESEENDHAAQFLEWLRKCWKGNAVELVRWTDDFSKWGRESQKQFLLYGLHFLREMLVLTSESGRPLRLRANELTTAQNMAKVLDFHKITQVTALLNDNIYYVERNANPKILFLDTSISLHKILKNL
jgi:DNA polymerase-3 subunit delta'